MRLQLMFNHKCNTFIAEFQCLGPSQHFSKNEIQPHIPSSSFLLFQLIYALPKSNLIPPSMQHLIVLFSLTSYIENGSIQGTLLYSWVQPSYELWRWWECQQQQKLRQGWVADCAFIRNMQTPFLHQNPMPFFQSGVNFYHAQMQSDESGYSKCILS